MRLLLDTHTLVWALMEPDKLSQRVQDLLSDVDNQIFYTPASAFEITVKHKKGKWPEVSALAVDFTGAIEPSGFEELLISSAQMALAGGMAGEHKDPFDRMIAAQSLLSGIPVASIDAALDQFNVQRIW